MRDPKPGTRLLGQQHPSPDKNAEVDRSLHSLNLRLCAPQIEKQRINYLGGQGGDIEKQKKKKEKRDM